MVTVALIILNLLVFLYQGYLRMQGTVLNDGIAWQDRGLAPPAFDPQSYQAHLLSGGSPRLYPLSRDDYFVIQYALVPAEFLKGVDLPPAIPVPIWVTLFTSMFLHGSFLHLFAEDLRKTGDIPRVADIPQYRTCFNRCQLVFVPQQKKARVQRKGLNEFCHQCQIYH